MVGLQLLWVHTILLLLLGAVLSDRFTNDWVVVLQRDADVNHVADLHGFENMGQIHEDQLENVYHFRHRSVEPLNSKHRRDVTETLNKHHMVMTSEQDEVLQLHKRSSRRGGGSRKRKSVDEVVVEKGDTPNDPNWNDEWFINSEDSGAFADYQYNINVQAAWDKGYNGTGVVVCVIDDGLERTHLDLVDNYDPLASYDMQDDDNDPSPRYASNEPNRHGTRCAGEIAGAFNNSVCGVGVAFGTNIGGIRILDGPVTRIMESKALGFNIAYVDIFSASWGPPDNGKAMDGPKGITAMVLEQAMAKGRDGKGTIYVWAGGNGGKMDDCNADGYQTMRYSVSINAVSLNGDTPYYAEPCASALASTFSSGYSHSIATTDIHGDCTTSHSGTSAAAPIAAGIVALVLQANPDLTWRDVQHVLIRCAIPNKLFHHEGWVRNAVGRPVHVNFGYGILDADRAVEIAKNWTNVREDHRCMSPELTYNRAVPGGEEVIFEIPFDGCEGSKEEVRYSEHVYLQLDISTPKRGDVTIDMISPGGTFVQMISKRPMDNDNVGFRSWRLMSVFFFGENPSGTWKVKVSNVGKFTVEVNTLFLDVFGTKEAPIEPNLELTTDQNVCDTLCDLGDKDVRDAKNRCKRCKEIVQVDVQRRSNLPFI